MASTASEVPLVDPEDLDADFSWRQRIVVTYADESHKAEAILARHGATLQVLFLTPFGTRALLLEQRGAEVTAEYFVDRQLPFPPRYILADIHRALFRGFEGPDRRQDLVGSGTERLLDDYVGDALKRRQVVALEPTERVLLEVDYRPPYVPGGPPPASIEIRNPEHGYALLVTTIPQ